jgi:hypothetical protein
MSRDVSVDADRLCRMFFMFNDGVGCGDVITRRGFIAFSSGSRPDGRC